MIAEINVDTEVILLCAKYEPYQFKNMDNTKEDNAMEYMIWVFKEKGYLADLKEKRNKIRVERPTITDAR